MSSPASLKRSYADTGLDERLRDETTPTPSAPTQAIASSQACSSSPNPANLPMSTSSAALNNPTAAIPGPADATAEKSNKRNKLTFAEKDARQIEKQFKEQQKAEEKTKREEEKAKRDEEKFKRDEERRAKDAEKEERKKVKEEQAKLREAEKQRKLEEKQKAEEEKNKKARVCYWSDQENRVGSAEVFTVAATSQCFLCPAFHPHCYTKCITNPRYSKSTEQPAQLDCGDQGDGRPQRTIALVFCHATEDSATRLRKTIPAFLPAIPHSACTPQPLLAR